MKQILSISQILVYYDLPQIMVVENIVGTKYIALLVEDTNEETKYLTTPISSTRLANFVSGKVDLREIFEKPEIEQYYTFDHNGDNFYAYPFDEKIPPHYLPDEGFIFGEISDSNDIIVKEVMEMGNAVVHLSLSDKDDKQSIMADNLGDIIKFYQQFVENSFKKGLTKNSPDYKSLYSRPENYKLRAFAASPGSFNLHMYADAQTNLFGGSIIEIALKKFDEILSGDYSEEELLSILRSVKGHTVSSLKHFLEKIISLDIRVKHKWFAPDQTEVHTSYVDKQKAEKITSLLNASDELSEEIKEYVGHFVQLDTEKRTWRLFNSDDNKEYSGTASEDISLLGITLDTQRVYRIICNEILEEAKVSEKEKTKLILMSVQPSQTSKDS